MADFSVVESNTSATSAVTGSLGQPGTGFQVLGVAFAGRSSSGTGPGAAFQGIYGTLKLNADGSFTYLLDNNDADTNQLAAGEVTDERFTYTYMLNGQVLTARLVFHITGADEADQVVHNVTSTISRSGDLTIAANERYVIAASSGINSVADSDGDLIVNNGSVRVGGVSATGTGAMHLDPNPYSQAGTQLINNGRIVAYADLAGINNIGNTLNGIGVSGITQPQTINNGVISVRNTVTGAMYASALAVAAGNAVNNGLVEAYSDTAGAGAYNLGLYTPTLINTGVIRVSGGAQANPIEINGITAASTDVHIENSGTIDVSSSAAGGHSIGISIFPNNTNIYQGGVILNSGRIVAEIAIQGTEGYNGSLTVTNTGIIEGDYLRDRGHDVVTNAAGASWTGNLSFGTTADLFRNAGTVTGRVTLGDGADFFDGRGGTVSGGIEGGAGHDVLIGGGAADTLSGGNGNDAIQGDAGADTLTGGAGADLFVYAAGDSTAAARDTITDFTSGADRIDLSRLGVTNVTISTSGGATIVAGDAATGAFSIAVNGAVAMSDLILTAQTGSLTGTAGDDVLLAALGGVTLSGAGGDDTLIGSGGADLIDGGSGADTMFGGAGDDIYVIDNDGDRVLETADGGHDLVRTYIGYSLQYWVEDGTILGNAAVDLLGTAAGNALTGNAAANQINGLAGDDVITGGGGGDYLLGGAGADRFVYLAPTDSVLGAMDYLRFFEHGTDIIDLRAIDVTGLAFEIVPNNNVTAFYTNVTITTAGGPTMTIRVDDKASLADFLLPDLRHGTEGPDELAGGAGSDTLSGAGGDDILRGQAGDDVLHGDAGNDTLWGGAGNDWLYGDAGADTMRGEDGDDHYVAEAGDTVIEAAGQGYDTVHVLTSYVLAAGSEIEVLTADDSAGVAGIDLTGNAFDNQIVGNAGNNALYGGDGADVIDGGAGNDWLDGGDGIDTADYGSAAAGVDVDLSLTSGQVTGGAGTDTLVSIEAVLGSGHDDVLAGGGNADWLQGGGGADQISGGEGANSLWGGDGNDSIDGGAGDDTIVGGAGFDTVSYAAAAGAVEIDLSWIEDQNTRGAGTDILVSIEGVIGSAFADRLIGDAQANLLRGDAGDDVLIGGGGDDALFGDGGADLFVFAPGSGNDMIADFTSGVDRIDVSAYGFASFEALLAATTVQDGNSIVALGGDNSLRLHGVLPGQLDEGDFVLTPDALHGI